MSRIRKAIRHRIVEILSAKTSNGRYIVDVGGRVFSDRPSPVFLHELPCVLVYFHQESIEEGIAAPRKYDRTVTMHTDILMQTTEDSVGNTEDLADDIAAQIEAVLFTDWTVGNLALDLKLKGCVPAIINFDTEHVLFAQRLIWEVTYDQPGFVEYTLDEFLTMQATITDAELGGSVEIDTNVRGD